MKFPRALAPVLVALSLTAACHQPPTPGASPSASPAPTSATSTSTPAPPPVSVPPGTSAPVPTPPPTTAPPPVPAPVEVAGALRPLPAPTGCTVNARDAQAAAAVAAAKPGDRVCITGNVGKVMIRTSGTEAAPVAILGDGETVATKLDIRADWVFVSGLNIVEPKPAPGISVTGNHVQVWDSTVDKPIGGDGDAIRFWGSDLRFAHNTLSRTSNKNGHADCAQNFSTDKSYPETRDVFFEWNRCEDIANICLISEGPDSSYGDGSGKGDTARIIFRHNYCQARSAQGLWLDDVQGWVVEGNTFDGGVHHAVGATNFSTGGVFRDNKLIGIKCEVGMDSTSRTGYSGPASKCDP